MEKSICENCKHFREVQSSEVVFTERIQICSALGIEWPCEKYCESFEEK